MGKRVQADAAKVLPWTMAAFTLLIVAGYKDV